MCKILPLAVSLASGLLVTCHAWIPLPGDLCKITGVKRIETTRCEKIAYFSRVQACTTSSSALGVDKRWFVPDDELEEEDDDLPEGWVTNEMLQKDLLADPQVKRKNKKKGGYKPLDNRDHLPFAVQEITPDPYTRPEVKKQRKIKAPNKLPKSDLLSSRLSLVGGDGKDNTSASTGTLLGEFQLDKSTTCGDIISLANGRHYKVEKARCQYKYAGGQRFVMIRKILEVKEISRAIQEAQLEQLLSVAVSDNNDDDSLESEGTL